MPYGAGNSISFGTPVIGGSPGEVLYIDGAGNVVGSPTFIYDGVTLTLNSKMILTDNSGILTTAQFISGNLYSALSDNGISDSAGVFQDAIHTVLLCTTTLAGSFNGATTFTQTDSTKSNAVFIQGYSDGGTATKTVLQINNNLGVKMCTLAGSGLPGSGDYGSVNFFGTATAAFDGFSFGDFNWINSSGEATGDLRMGTFRVFRDGDPYHGSFQLVLRKAAGGFSVPLQIRYDTLTNISDNDFNFIGQLTVVPNAASIPGITVQAQSGQTANLLETRNSGSTVLTYINASGNVGIRLAATAATAYLHLKAGTTAANNSPLKFNSGSLLTTAEAGAVEFLTDKFYGTITTGAARKEFALNDAALTSGRVPFNTTNGRLTDSANMTFDGTNFLSNGLKIGSTQQTIFNTSGLATQYNAIATVSNGIPSEYATIDLTAQSAAIAATTAYAVPASGLGLYRISWVATITTAATTSSILGGANGFQVKYTDGNDSVVKTSLSPTITSSVNATSTQISGVELAYCKASTNLQYLFDYTSVGVTAMQYNLHIKVEAL